MGEVQEQRYVCKICYKSCVSGKSLAGHMRGHLALISASKKAAQVKVESKMEFEDGDDQNGSCKIKESSKNQSNSAVLSEEKIKNGNSNMDFGDSNPNNSYELRDNPRKSWRISDSKHGVPKKGASCKECGKEFLSLRALSVHIRCHSIKNREVHQCKKCGKVFDSMRAMFGHMKSHSKKSRVPHDSGKSLSDLDNLCPISRKRSRVGYKITSNSYLSCPNPSTSAVSELGEVGEMAMCLMMLSRGVRDCYRLNSVRESSDDDSVYFGAESSCESKKIAGKDGDFVSDSDKILKMSRSNRKLDHCICVSASAFSEKGVSDFDGHGSMFAVENEMKVDFRVCDEELVSVEDKIKVDFGVSDVDELKEPEKESAVKDLLVPIVMNEAKSIHDSGFGKNSSEKNGANNLEILKDLETKHEYKWQNLLQDLPISPRANRPQRLA